MTIALIILSFKLAAIAYVYTIVLTESGMLLGRFYGWISGIANRYPRTEWFLKPIILCDRCVAGQFGLWGFILLAVFKVATILLIVDFLFVISLTIIISQLFKKLLHG